MLQFIVSCKNQKIKPNNFLTEMTIFVHKIKKTLIGSFFSTFQKVIILAKRFYHEENIDYSYPVFFSGPPPF